MAPPKASDLDLGAINALRFLAVDMVEEADSGHPGAPLGQAPLAYLLWTRFLRFDPQAPNWPNRDRFVLSCGHASALLYALLHLAGYDLPLDELRRFRQFDSRTPGHPEFGLTPGVETTTGPLGQGFANAVGMAMAERLLAARFNRPGLPLFDHRVWVLASDGDLMEGVASEAASLAGHHRLGSLKVLYDANRITIDGSTDLAFSEDVPARFRAYGWRTLEVADGNDLGEIEAALAAAAAESDRPTLVRVQTRIGYGSPNKQDSADAHGAPLGAEETRLTKQALGWPHEPSFWVPEETRRPFRAAAERGGELRQRWLALRDELRLADREAAAELDRRLAGQLPASWDAGLPRFAPGDKPIATRSASGKALNALARRLPELVGGSADLSGSNNTLIDGEADFSPQSPGARNLRFGVREHAMGAIANGLAASGLLRPYVGTFLIFSDYLRPAIRLAALMKLPVVYVFTHDSIFLGEDGPTHQPVDQLASLRAIPGLVVLRPADANETTAAWRLAIARREGPTALVLSRQKLPILLSAGEIDLAAGARAVIEPTGRPDLVLVGSGSEVAPLVETAAALAAEGSTARVASVVSLASWELFAQAPAEQRQALLPEGVPRLAVEAAASHGWSRWLAPGDEGVFLDRFGASAPHRDLARRFGFDAESLTARARQLLQRRTKRWPGP